MFTTIFTDLAKGKTPDPELLRRHFDLAMTKKLGVVKLPPAFWMQDSKINPRADHLLQAALLLGDRERCDLAVSALAVELAEKRQDETLGRLVQQILAELLHVAPAASKEKLRLLGDDVVAGLSGTEQMYVPH